MLRHEDAVALQYFVFVVAVGLSSGVGSGDIDKGANLSNGSKASLAENRTQLQLAQFKLGEFVNLVDNGRLVIKDLGQAVLDVVLFAFAILGSLVPGWTAMRASIIAMLP